MEDKTDHFDNAFIHENVAYVYDVWWRYEVHQFTAYAILFREIQCKKRDIEFFAACLVQVWLQQGKICKNTNQTFVTSNGMC